jgi:5-methyltetrahydropteroyltriglutamate--homocysteine methyltransferase
MAVSPEETKAAAVAMHRPPFRAEHVGSLLRPPELKEARASFARGEIDAARLRTAEDLAITKAIQQQEHVGLPSITDGEMRRAFWNYDFLESLDGVHSELAPREGFQFKNAQSKPKKLSVRGKLGASREHPMVGHFRFVRERAKGFPKMTIPSPTALHFRFGRKNIDQSVYPEMGAFYADLAATYRKVIEQFTRAGCRYLQLDEVYLAYLCDPEQRATLAARGDDPATLPRIYADLINSSIAQAPRKVTIGLHLCRGNFRSSFVASGGYEPVAELLFNDIAATVYFMEFDTERAGGFEPLRFLPKNKVVVLGLVTTKSGELETKDEIKRRIDAAARFVPVEQLALSPQCGFSSTEEGNFLSESEQWRKLAMVVEVAEQVWGRG